MHELNEKAVCPAVLNNYIMADATAFYAFSHNILNKIIISDFLETKSQPGACSIIFCKAVVNIQINNGQHK